MPSFQNNVNVIMLESEDFKLSIGSLNNRFFICGSRVTKHFAIGIVLAVKILT